MRFQGTGSESALALGAETTFGIGNTTLTEFIPVMTFDVNYEVNKRDTPAAQMAMKLPSYSSRMNQRQTWSFTAPLWAEGLEFFWQMAMGRYQQTDDLTSTGLPAGIVFAHSFLGSTSSIPIIDGLTTDPLCDGMAMGFYTGDLSPQKGRFVKLRGCLVSRFSINIAPGAATLSADGIFYDSSFDSTPPTLGWDAGYLFTPLDTNISFQDSTISTATIDQSLNRHWFPWNWALNWDNKIDQDFPFFYNANLPRQPATPFRGGPVEATINFEVDAMGGAGGGGGQVERGYDASMTTAGRTFRDVYEQSRPFHGYIESFGATIFNYTTSNGSPRRRTFKFIWDFAQLTDWKTPYTGAGNYRHRCEAQLFEPPAAYFGEMATLFLTNTRAGFAQYPTGI